jgi:hypothetical protein
MTSQIQNSGLKSVAEVSVATQQLVKMRFCSNKYVVCVEAVQTTSKTQNGSQNIRENPHYCNPLPSNKYVKIQQNGEI